MTICFHCGEDLTETYLCPRCAKNYCSLHIDPIIHECKLIKETSDQSTTDYFPYIEPSYTDTFKPPDPTVPLITPEYYQEVIPQDIIHPNVIIQQENKGERCWYCGTEVQEVYRCHICLHSYCIIHKEQNTHECEKPITVSEPIQPSILPDGNILPSTEEKVETRIKFSDFNVVKEKAPLKAFIELDFHFIESSVNSFIEFYRNQDFSNEEDSESSKLKKLLLLNPNFKDIPKAFYDNQDLRFVRGLLIWLSSFEDRISGLKQICGKRGYTLEDIDLIRLYKFYNSYIIDASYFNKYIVENEITQESFEKITLVQGNVLTTKKCLTDISEHARKSGDRECTGFLIGKRNESGLLIEINRYLPLTLSVSTRASIGSKEMIDLMIDLQGTDNLLVGWMHSHPLSGASSFSKQDQITHLKHTRMFSFIHSFRNIQSNVPIRVILETLSHISNYDFPQAKFLYDVVRTCIQNLHNFKQLHNILIKHSEILILVDDQIKQRELAGEIVTFQEKSQEYMSCFEPLKSEIDNFLRNNQITLIQTPVKYIPFAGGVICPWTRELGLISCNVENYTYSIDIDELTWYYFRLNL